MAALTAPQRLAVLKAYAEDERTSHAAILRADVVAAIAAIDDYFDTNATAINTALPATYRTNATLSQKSRLVRYVIAARYP
jgi:hypothetical protein